MQLPDLRNIIAQHITERAMTDEAFRSTLLANPRQAIEAEIGHALPDGMKVTVLEETVDSVYLVLPSQTGFDNELTEVELAAVSGAGYSAGSGDAADCIPMW